MASSSFKEVWKEYKNTLDDYCKQVRVEADRGQEEFSLILEELKTAAEEINFPIPSESQKLFLSLPELIYVGQVWSYMHHQHAVAFIEGPINDHVNYERMHSMDEIWDSLNKHGEIAATAILQRLRCNEYEDIEKLITLYKSGEKDAFIQKLKSMSCDLSHLYLACEYTPYKAGFSPSTDVEDLLAMIDYHSARFDEDKEEDNPIQEHINSYSESVQKWLPRIMSLQDESISDSGRLQSLKDFLEKGIIEIADLGVGLLNYIIENTKWMFGFEKEVLSKSIQHPSIQFLLNYKSKDIATEPTVTAEGMPEVEEQYRYMVPLDVFDADKRILDDKYYVHNLVKAVTTGDNPVERFQKLFRYVLQWGRVENKADQDAMLTLLTGYYVPGATSKARWCAEEYMPRVLYHIVKHISKSRNKYKPLEYVDFYSDNQQAVNADLRTIREGNTSTKADESVPSGVRRMLSGCYPSLFQKPEE